MTRTDLSTVQYAALVRQFRAAPPGKLYMLHGSGRVFRLSLTAAAHVLLADVPLAVVDGCNRFDAYFIAEFARRFAGSPGAARGVTPDQLLERIFVSRAFTCYQMEALVTDRLPAFLDRSGAPVVLIFGLLDTFYDEQAPMFEVRNSLQRIITALRRLKQAGVSVLLASETLRPASDERRTLLPMITAAMDKVVTVEKKAIDSRQ